MTNRSKPLRGRAGHSREIAGRLTTGRLICIDRDQAAIDAAIAEAKGYLTRFDCTRVFSASGNKRNQLLLIFVKDIATWHLINLCNAGTDLKFRQDRYERAIDWLKAVQRAPSRMAATPSGASISKRPLERCLSGRIIK